MINLLNIRKNLLLEQDSKLMVLKKAITKRIPITINYQGPSPEVKSGVRYDIEPIVMGNHFRSGNLVIWAYVYKGTSKKGLPDWKMFRIDRIQSIKFAQDIPQFNPNKLPGYEKGKAPNAMKSLENVITFSPYWYDDKEKYKIGRPSQEKPEPEEKPTQEPISPEVEKPASPEIEKPVEKPEMSTTNYENEILNNLKNKVQDIDGQKIISKNDFEDAVNDLYNKKEGEWKNYQRQMSGNIKPGEGTRNRFDNESRNELNDLLNQNNINVYDEILSEQIKRIKQLIF